MTVNDITTIISCLGFPIVACGAMGFYVKYITDQNAKRMDAMTESHKDEMSDITKAIQNNTLAIQKLTDYLTMKEGK